MLTMGIIAYGATHLFSGEINLGLAHAQKLHEAPVMNSVYPIRELPIEVLSVGTQTVKMYQNGQDLTYQLSIDPDLQHFIDRKLQKYRLDWAGVAVMDPDTGRVLALSSFSSKKPDQHALSLTATFPAASIFKVVTASALIDQTQKGPTSTFSYAGDMRKIRKQYLESNYRGTSMTLSKAFAKSANGIFGVIGSQYLEPETLLTYASRFGFNQRIPFELPVQTSSLHLTEHSEVDLAKLAAGFGEVTLSPLHGAMIAGSIINEGKMMKPTIIDTIKDERQTHYMVKPHAWKTPFSKENASDLRKMMQHTIASGTARKSFRHVRNDDLYTELEVGGKTGSLYGKTPRGRNEWFVSYAYHPQTGKKLAMGIVIVNEKYWKIKPAQLSNWIIQKYFEEQKQKNVVASLTHDGTRQGS